MKQLQPDIELLSVLSHWRESGGCLYRQSQLRSIHGTTHCENNTERVSIEIRVITKRGTFLRRVSLPLRVSSEFQLQTLEIASVDAK